MIRILGAVLALFSMTACAAGAAEEISRTDFVLGTVCSVRILEGGSSKTSDQIFARLREIEDRMSANKEGTQIAAVNAAAGKSAVVVTADTFFVVSKALEYARRSEGLFDPTVGPLVKLWNIGSDGAKVPQKADIAAALALIDNRKVQMDPKASTIKLLAPGMRLDLGAIAKGYAADEVARILAENRVKSAVVDLGGNVLVFGAKRDGSPWRVGIQDPATQRGDYLGLVTGKAMTVVTSGIYERFFIENGVRYHHILDTKTGFPVDNGLTSLSIITSSSIDADALSTTVFSMGLEKGMEFVKGLKGVNAIFVDSKNRVYLSPGTNAMFKLTSTNYTLAELKP